MTLGAPRRSDRARWNQASCRRTSRSAPSASSQALEFFLRIVGDHALDQHARFVQHHAPRRRRAFRQSLAPKGEWLVGTQLGFRRVRRRPNKPPCATTSASTMATVCQRLDFLFGRTAPAARFCHREHAETPAAAARWARRGTICTDPHRFPAGYEKCGIGRRVAEMTGFRRGGDQTDEPPRFPRYAACCGPRSRFRALRLRRSSRILPGRGAG